MHENLYFNDTLTREALERSLAPDEASGAREEAEGRHRRRGPARRGHRHLLPAERPPPLGISHRKLQRLVSRGIVENFGNGLYRLTEVPATELETIAMVAAAVPSTIVCLLTALQFHDYICCRHTALASGWKTNQWAPRCKT